MPRSIWKGAISFGLVTVPVALYSAVERKGELAFRQLHKKDALPIEYKRFCQAENVEVPWDDIVKGYQYAQGQYVIMTDEDFEKARVPAAQTITIRTSSGQERSTSSTSNSPTTWRPRAAAA